MHARLVNPDATTQAVSLPARLRALKATGELTGSRTVAIVHVIRPGPRRPGAGLWLKDGIPAGRPPGNPAAPTAAFLSGTDLRQDVGGLALFSGGPSRKGQITGLTSEYDQIITTIAAQIRPPAPSGTPGRPTGGTPGVEVR